METVKAREGKKCRAEQVPADDHVFIDEGGVLACLAPLKIQSPVLIVAKSHASAGLRLPVLK